MIRLNREEEEPSKKEMNKPTLNSLSYKKSHLYINEMVSKFEKEDHFPIDL